MVNIRDMCVSQMGIFCRQLYKVEGKQKLKRKGIEREGN
jgi:hypothetical protein